MLAYITATARGIPAVAQGASIFRYLTLNYKSCDTARERKKEGEREEREGEAAYFRPRMSCNRRVASQRESPTEQEKEKSPLALCP